MAYGIQCGNDYNGRAHLSLHLRSSTRAGLRQLLRGEGGSRSSTDPLRTGYCRPSGKGPHTGELPQTLVFFVSIIKAPQKADQWSVIEMANTTIKDYCMATGGLAFIDLNPVMFDDLHKPRLGLYLDDGLHLKPAAYKEFASIIRPFVERAWSSLTADHQKGDCLYQLCQLTRMPIII